MALEINKTVDGVPANDGSRVLEIHTNAGVIDTRLHRVDGATTGLLWVFGAGGGLSGPAGGMYVRLAQQLVKQGLASLRLDYRKPGHLMSCVLDALAGIHVLEGMGLRRLILVGHSFGGAVAISAGAASPSVVGVVAMSSQTDGTGAVDKLAPKALLLMHGMDDEVLPAAASEDIFRRAAQPKQMLLYPGCKHGLDQCREAVDADLLNWIRSLTVMEA